MARTGIRSAGIIIRESKVLLLHRKNNGQEYWVFPGGGIEVTETAEECVIREIKEELNMEATNPQLAFMYEVNGTEHPMFLVDVKGEPELGAEAKDRNSDENFYAAEWTEISELETLGTIYPKEAIRYLHELIQ